MFSITRIYSDINGDTHFEVIEIPLEEAGRFILINLSCNWLWYAASTIIHSLKPGVSKQTIKSFRNIYMIGFPVYVAAFVVAFFSATVSLVICMLLWIHWAIAIRKFNQ